MMNFNLWVGYFTLCCTVVGVVWFIVTMCTEEIRYRAKHGS